MNPSRPHHGLQQKMTEREREKERQIAPPRPMCSTSFDVPHTAVACPLLSSLQQPHSLVPSDDKWLKDVKVCICVDSDELDRLSFQTPRDLGSKGEKNDDHYLCVSMNCWGSVCVHNREWTHPVSVYDQVRVYLITNRPQKCKGLFSRLLAISAAAGDCLIAESSTTENHFAKTCDGLWVIFDVTEWRIMPPDAALKNKCCGMGVNKSPGSALLSIAAADDCKPTGSKDCFTCKGREKKGEKTKIKIDRREHTKNRDREVLCASP